MNKRNPTYDPDTLYILYDAVFKAVFTKDTPASKGALRALLSAMIEQELDIIDILANEPPIDDIHDRAIRFDIRCSVRKTGEPINIEMTLYPDYYEAYRLEYLASKLLCSQYIKGSVGSFGDLKPSYQISFLANIPFLTGVPMFADEHFLHNFQYYDSEHSVALGGQIRIITVELYKLDSISLKAVAEMSKRERWFVFFQYHEDKGKQDLIQELVKAEEGIRMAQEAYSGITQDAHEQARLLSLWKGQMDIQSKMVTAARMTEKAEQEREEERQGRVKAEQEREKERQGREKERQGREKAEQRQKEAEQKLAQERERAEQKLAQERERSIAAMRALGMSDKDIDKIYPDK
ncbi:Rpn family recombination-promoting nuclease/putative transposase [Breznakiellaceae bacterium SP9]